MFTPFDKTGLNVAFPLRAFFEIIKVIQQFYDTEIKKIGNNNPSSQNKKLNKQ